MPVNRNALIRFKTIDKCLSNPYRRWTLEDLIDACSDALYEYEGIDKGVSRRTVQADIQLMRSDKLGYNAPIVVYENKYYKYDDPEYSITNMPLTEQDLEKLTEVMGLLREFKGFSHFQELSGIIQKLEDKVYTEKSKQASIIDIEKNENLKGLEYLDAIYNSILKSQVLSIGYQSYRAKQPGNITFHPYLLKEYRNRWFVLGRKSDTEPIVTLALDRICSVESDEKTRFVSAPDFDPKEYYKNVIGVTVNNEPAKTIHLFVHNSNAPYIITKPLHHSQKLIKNTEKGIEITIEVVPNYELEREIISYGDSIQVLSPMKLRDKIVEKFRNALGNYTFKG